MDRTVLVGATVLALVIGPALSSGAGPIPAERVRALNLEAPAPGGVDQLAKPLSDGPSSFDSGSRLEPVEGIGPGSRLRIERPDGSYGCTANFVFEDPEGNRYLGTAGHCLVPDDHWGTHGPFADLDPSGIEVAASAACPVQVFAESCIVSEDPVLHELGGIVYAQNVGDFAVIEIPDEHRDLIRPEMPEWGGPDGVAAADEGDNGDTILYYGHGAGLGKVEPTRARAGVLADEAPDSTWWHAAAPVAWGDSGSPVVLAADDEPPLTGGGAFGVVTHLGPSGPRIGSVLANVRCWAGLDLRVVPNGSFLERCPRPDVGSEGAHGTVMATDPGGGGGGVGTEFADVERVWLDSDGSHVRFTFRVADLRTDQPRTRYKSHWGSPDESGPVWSVYCYSGGHGGVLSSSLECNGYPAEWDVERDLLWAEIPYSAFGWESGDTVSGVLGSAQIGDPVWYGVHVFSGNGTHTLS